MEYGSHQKNASPYKPEDLSSRLVYYTPQCKKDCPKTGILSRWICKAIYWNSDEAHVFCSSLSFQQAPLYICMLNRSRVTAGFVKIIARTLPENERKLPLTT